MDVKSFKATATLDGDEGSVKAAFSVFHTVDDDGDVVLPSFFKDGQEIPMAAWGHAWGNLPPGKGVIRVQQDHAEFDGRFFLNTTQGRDHYETIKAMGDLQEWSFGFKVTGHEYAQKDGQRVRLLKAGETYEASPVLIGANRRTFTAAIKGQSRSWDDQDEALTLELEDYLARARSLADLRAKEGRALSGSRRTRLEQMRDVLTGGLEELNRLLEETAPRSADDESEGDGAKQIRQIQADYLAGIARELGVEV